MSILGTSPTMISVVHYAAVRASVVGRGLSSQKMGQRLVEGCSDRLGRHRGHRVDRGPLFGRLPRDYWGLFGTYSLRDLEPQ